MFLKKLQLTNFRNYENQYFEFSEGLNCVVGKNGSGKTNIIDAIYFLSLTKSSIHNQDQLSIKFEQDYMQIEGFFENKKSGELISCFLQRAGKKQFFYDKIPYERISEHIGKYPTVLIAPDDTDLIRDSAEARRKLFDGIISQVNPEYLKVYQLYNRTLDQRNSLLKQFAENNYFDDDLLHIYSDELLTLAHKIYDFRLSFLNLFLPIFKKYYAEISESSEAVEMIYVSELANADFNLIFKKNTKQDVAAQRTLKGTHKDDFEFLMEQKSIKKFGSQGQKKSFIMAIRLAQFEIITNLKDYKPILLLDDIFDKLDEKRIKKLVEMIKNQVFGQIFLTDARPNRTKDLMNEFHAEVNFIDINKSE